MALNSILEKKLQEEDSIEKKKSSIKIKIFDPIPNKNWLETKVNTWLEENNIEIISINMSYNDDKYLLTLIYRMID